MIKNHFRRTGFTLIELLVVFGVVSLLAAILIPAIQAVREAARRAHCASNLHNLGLGIDQYVSVNSVFPTGKGGIGQSFVAHVLPFIDQLPLYNTFNWNFPIGGNQMNHTSRTTRLSLLLCPSDAFNNYQTSTNYAGCFGSIRLWENTGDGLFSDRLSSPSCLGPASVRDGMSHTAAVTEWLSGQEQHSDRLRGTFTPSDTATPVDATILRERCLSLEGMKSFSLIRPGKGHMWAAGVWGTTLYDHFLGINNPSCLNAQGPGGIVGTFGASSGHRSGVNVLFADGHVQFVEEHVMEQVWKAFATRDGRELPSN